MIHFTASNTFAIKAHYDRPLSPGQSVELTSSDSSVVRILGDVAQVVVNQGVAVINAAVQIDANGGPPALSHAVKGDINLAASDHPIHVPSGAANGELMVLFIGMPGAGNSFKHGDPSVPGSGGPLIPDARFTWRGIDSAQSDPTKEVVTSCGLAVMTGVVAPGDQDTPIDLGEHNLYTAHLRCFRNASYGGLSIVTGGVGAWDTGGDPDPHATVGDPADREAIDMPGAFQSEAWCASMQDQFSLGLSGGQSVLIDDPTRGFVNLSDPSVPVAPDPPGQLVSADFAGTPSAHLVVTPDPLDPDSGASAAPGDNGEADLTLTIHGSDPIIRAIAHVKRRCAGWDTNVPCRKVLVVTRASATVGGTRVQQSRDPNAALSPFVKPAYLP